jgi:predicted secreted protein
VIISTKPVLKDKNDETETRKALQNLVDQLNREIDELKARVYALENP